MLDSFAFYGIFGYEESRVLLSRQETFLRLQAGALCKATKLRKLYITAYNGVKNFNFPGILEYNHGLRHLVIDVSFK